MGSKHQFFWQKAEHPTVKNPEPHPKADKAVYYNRKMTRQSDLLEASGKKKVGLERNEMSCFDLPKTLTISNISKEIQACSIAPFLFQLYAV